MPRAPLFLPLLLLGCAETARVDSGGKHPPQALDTSPVPESSQALFGAGHRCQGHRCTCRPVDDYGRGRSAEEDAEAQPPAEGLKRFELRTGRGMDLTRITIEGLGTFTKEDEGPEPACFYIDLNPGVYRVRYHVTARDPGQGVEPRLRVSEYSARFQRWYRTFAFRCASGDAPCTKDDARDAIAQLSRVPKGKHDPCGSTKVQGLHFYSERPADEQVSDFSLQFVLNVYKFTPRFPPEAKSCKGVSGDAP